MIHIGRSYFNVWNVHDHLCSLLTVPVSYFCFVSLNLYTCTYTLHLNIECTNQTNTTNLYAYSATIFLCSCAMLILWCKYTKMNVKLSTTKKNNNNKIKNPQTHLTVNRAIYGRYNICEHECLYQRCNKFNFFGLPVHTFNLLFLSRGFKRVYLACAALSAYEISGNLISNMMFVWHHLSASIFTHFSPLDA